MVPPKPFVLESSSAGVFKGGDDIVSDETLACHGSQLGWTFSDGRGDKLQTIFFQAIFESRL